MPAPLRILAEFLEPLAHFRREKVRDTVVFFGSARIREDGPLASITTTRARSPACSPNGRDSSPTAHYRFVVCSGGGPGIMEAANRGAAEAGGKTIGLNIGLPFEQFPNPYITPELSFEFHYFFMRKFWFAYLAKALVVFPGGFGTMDELFELLTLVQTKKLTKKIIIVLYGTKFWTEVINFDALGEIRHDRRNRSGPFQIRRQSRNRAGPDEGEPLRLPPSRRTRRSRHRPIRQTRTVSVV